MTASHLERDEYLTVERLAETDRVAAQTTVRTSLGVTHLGPARRPYSSTHTITSTTAAQTARTSFASNATTTSFLAAMHGT